MKRLARRLTALFAIAALLFSQLAGSAYACPADRVDHAAAAENSATDGCHELATPNLCDRHCDYGSATSQASVTPAFTADLALLPWRLESVQSGASRPARFAHEFPRRVDPPPLVLFGFLRI